MAPKGDLKGAIEAYEAALLDCEPGETPNARQIASDHGCDHTTLSRRVGGYTQSAQAAQVAKQALTPSEEDQLVNYIRRTSQIGHPPAPSEILEVATIMRDNRVLLLHDPNPRLPPPSLGKHWVDKFRERHKHILRTTWSRHLDNERLKADSRENLQSWFAEMKVMRDKHHYRPSEIYNMDETGYSIGGPTRSTRVVVMKERGKQRKAKKGGMARGEWTTSIECISASGMVLKPLVIFKGKYMATGYVPNSPLVNNWSWTTSKSGWTNNGVALQWLRLVFEPQTATNPPRRRLLIVDGHGSHVTSGFIAFCMDHGIDLMVLPPHSSAISQPLDVGVFGPLKQQYDRLLDSRSLTFTSAQLTKAEFGTYVARARDHAMTKDNILAGFRATGIEPFLPSRLLGPRAIDTVTPHTPPPPPPAPLPSLSSQTRDLITSQVDHLLTPIKNRLVELSCALESSSARNLILEKDLEEAKAEIARPKRAANSISVKGTDTHVFTTERMRMEALAAEARRGKGKGKEVILEGEASGEDAYGQHIQRTEL